VNKRKIRELIDPGFWMLLAANGYIMVYVYRYPAAIHTVIALFWIQSVIIGVFTVLHMFMELAGEKRSHPNAANKRDGCVPFFFLFHYGFFHLVYLVFLVAKLVNVRELDWPFLQISFWLLIAAGLVEFIKDRVRARHEQMNGAVLLFMPYVRIIPMHLIILIPAFFDCSMPLMFLVLKTMADLLMYLIYKRAMFTIKS
jgi:hypothetical protein